MKQIFDIRTDKQTPIIQKRIKKGKSGFRTNWGLYGTNEWFYNLQNEGLILVLSGTLTRLFMSGHNDFPEFEINTGVKRFQFERHGNDDEYKIGKTLKVHAIKNKYIRPTSGLEELLVPIIIEIEN